MARPYVRKPLPDSGWEVLLYPRFYKSEEADVLLGRLKSDIVWSQGKVKLFGREIPEPRLSAWYGEFDYTYSSKHLPAQVFPAVLNEILDEVNCELDLQLNGVLCNRYRDGRDSMGWHSDDENELDHSSPIISLSFGINRTMQFRKKTDNSQKMNLELEHGSLLIMPGGFQSEFQHAIPKQKLMGERINLTYRKGG